MIFWIETLLLLFHQCFIISAIVTLNICFTYNFFSHQKCIIWDKSFFIDCKIIFRVLSLVFLFIVRLRFPLHKSIANVIGSLYNVEIVKLIPRFEKLNIKIRKNEADLDFFLQSCQQKHLIPKFVNFKVASSSLRFSRTYKQYLRQLLKQ